MTFDELPQEWSHREQSVLPVDVPRDDAIAQICRKVEKLNGVLDRRDLAETGAAVFVAIAFSGMTFTMKPLISRLGAGLVVLSALYIIYKLWRARTVVPRAAMDAPLKDFCAQEIDRIERQVGLLKSVLWWYIAPIIVGANLVMVGVAQLGWFSVVYLILSSLFGWFVYWLNQRAVDKSLVPPRDELRALLVDLEST